MNDEAKNLEAISQAIDDHNGRCDWPATAVAMNPHEVQRLGWDSIRGLPIEEDGSIGTGAFRILCDKPPATPEKVERKDIVHA